MAGTIQWKSRELVSTKQSSWYDHSFYKVGFTGEADLPRMSNALFRKVTNQFLSKFGGQTSLGEVKLADEPGFIIVEVLYHIGD